MMKSEVHDGARRVALIAIAIAFLAGVTGWSARQVDTTAGVDPIVFQELAPSGLKFVTRPCRTPHKHQPETMVAGVALFDYDNDGLLDIYLVNGATMPGLVKDSPQYYNRLFRNLGNGNFEDVTEKAGVQGRGYNLGVAVGDYDNDGFEDIFVAGLRGNILYHNNGDGTFTDVTAKAGLDRLDQKYGRLWAVTAAWVDYDRDGWLDLFVSNYCVWNYEKEPTCMQNGIPDYCDPRLYEGLPNTLFHNNHDGTFTDVSVGSGVRDSIGKGMGVAVADFDGDGWPDIFVANDTLPNSLFHNEQNGTFREMAVESGVAYTENGMAISGMGADARDIDNDGLPDIFEAALVKETCPVFHNLGRGLFEDITYTSGLSMMTLPRGGWSNGIYDFNNDGWKDLFIACAQVMDPNGSSRGTVEQPNAVFANLHNGRFTDLSSTAGPEFASHKAVHRGTAFGDLDNDGRVDVVVTALDAPPEVWRNASPTANHWLIINPIGTKSNRDGISAKIKIVTSSGPQYNHVTTAVGYGCASDRRVYFGLGKDSLVQELQVTWPSGIIQTLSEVKADQILTVREP
jgi:hypothetical protein